MKGSHILESRRLAIIFVLQLFVLFFFFHLSTCDSINVPKDKILLNCGSSGSSPFNGVNWIGDIGSTFLPPEYDKSSSTLLFSNIDTLAPKIPYSTARIIHSPLTYSFPFTPGLKFIQELELVFFTKDFLVNVKEEKLNITLTPSLLISNAFAFVNGIEIFSVPRNIYFRDSKVPVTYLGHQEPLLINDEYALEMLYRVNIFKEFSPDVVNVFGTWLDDFGYIYGSQYGSVLGIIERTVSMNYTTLTSKDYNYSAPEELYLNARTMGSNADANTRYNLTWSFPVDSGFKYLVRLHFCEISIEVTQVHQRVFSVYINNQTAEERMDVVALAGAPFTPLYRDYVVMVPMENGRRKDMWIALHPNLEAKSKYPDAILNGIEIIKLSDSNYSLAASFQLKREQKKGKVPHVIIMAGSLAVILGLLITFFILIHRAEKSKLRNFSGSPLSNSDLKSLPSIHISRD